MRSALLILCFISATPAWSADVELLPTPRTVDQAVEVLPAPLPLNNALPVLPAPSVGVETGPFGPALPGFWRKSQYDRWQWYGVDQQGFWRPRVVLAPQPYYLYNGMSYPWLSTRPTDLIPPGRH